MFTVAQRLLALIPLLADHNISYKYKAEAVEGVVVLLQPEAAKQFLQEHWRFPLKDTVEDIPSIAELVQQVLLPIGVRNQMYMTLRQMIS